MSPEGGHIPHIRQLSNWDCGLACLYMYLQACGHDFDYRTLQQRCGTTSVWTIDLAHLARSFQLGVEFTSLTLGPNPLYKAERFYMRHMQDDEQRVSALFQTARAAGIHVSQQSVTWQALAAALTCEKGELSLIVALVLVDKRRLPPTFPTYAQLSPPAQQQQQQQLKQRHMFVPSTQSLTQDSAHADPLSTAPDCTRDYIGHYLLLVSWDAASQQFFVHDPDSSTAPLFLSPSQLDHARKCFGTDEDVCVFSWPSRPVLMVNALSNQEAKGNASEFPRATTSRRVAGIEVQHRSGESPYIDDSNNLQASSAPVLPAAGRSNGHADVEKNGCASVVCNSCTRQTASSNRGQALFLPQAN